MPAPGREKDMRIKLGALEDHEVAGVVATIVDRGPEITIRSVTLARAARRSEEPGRREPGKPRNEWGRRV